MKDVLVKGLFIDVVFWNSTLMHITSLQVILLQQFPSLLVRQTTFEIGQMIKPTNLAVHLTLATADRAALRIRISKHA